MFFEQKGVNFAAYADDNTACFCEKNLEVFVSKLQICALKLFEWFSNNYMKMNSDKCHLILSSNDENKKIELNGEAINNTQVQKLLGVHIDYKLKFDTHIESLCKKVGKKLHALARIIKYMSTNQAQLLMRSFIMSQFSYCPLIWMCHSRKINTQINKLHERALRLVYNDKSSSFRELLERDNSVTIHERNIQVLLTEIFKVKSRAAPEIMTRIFKFKDHSYDSRKNNCLERRIIKSSKYGNEIVSNLGAKLWDILPENIKKAESLQEFKNKIKYWTPLNCPCKLCKTYIANVGYV